MRSIVDFQESLISKYLLEISVKEALLLISKIFKAYFPEMRRCVKACVSSNN